MEEKNNPSPIPPPSEEKVSSPEKSKQKSRLYIFIVSIIFIIASLSIYTLFTLNKQAPQQKKVYHIGVLSGLDFFVPVADGFKKEMTKLGYIEGKNIVYDIERTNVEPEKEKKILKKFINNKVDLVLTFPTEVSILAKKELTNSHIPLVFAGAFTEQGGLIKNVSDSGGNLTGVQYAGSDLAAKRLEILHEITPSSKRILIPYLKGYPIVEKEIEAVNKIAPTLGLQIILLPVTSVEDLKKNLSAKETQKDLGFDAILLIPEPIATSVDTAALLDTFSLKHKIVYGGNMRPGTLSIFSSQPDNVEMGTLAAPIADKILHGIPAGTISVATPNKYIYLNYKAAQELKISISDDLLNSAKVVIR